MTQNEKNDETKRAEALEARCIKEGRLNAMGELVMSAEPHNYWQDLTIKPMGYMTRTIGVYFNIGRWNPTDADIEQLIYRDLGYKNPHEKITAIGQNGKRVTLWAKDMLVKKEICNILCEKFPSKYRCVPLEEPETTVTLHYVPEDMPDNIVRGELMRYGELSTEETKLLKNALGFHNLQRRLTFINLKYDLPSYLRIKHQRLYSPN